MSTTKKKGTSKKTIVTIVDEAGKSVKYALDENPKGTFGHVFQTYAKGKGVERASLIFLLGNYRVQDHNSFSTFRRMKGNLRIQAVQYKGPNTRDSIEKLLATETSPGSYVSSSKLSKNCPVPTVSLVGDGGPPLSFPLNDADIGRIKAKAERAGVGLPDRTVVNLDVRTTWQIKPKGLSVTNNKPALDAALSKVTKELGTVTDYQVEAHLYKLLLYEEGCFFKRHRDNERLEGMFGTLCLELPSDYEGAELSVWSPLTPSEKKTFAHGKEMASAAQVMLPRMCCTAFYADCYHEVSELSKGHRVALIYHLTARPVKKRVLSHLPKPSALPPQPADEKVVLEIANLMKAYEVESNEDYPSTWEATYSDQGKKWPGKPKKLAIVLSHKYTPTSLTGIDALKGSDRSVAELVRAAALRCPSGTEAHEGAPFFDAALSLVEIWDHGECTAYGDCRFRTTSPLLSLTTKRAGKEVDLGTSPKPRGGGNRSLTIYPHEFLFASPGAGTEWRADKNDLFTSGIVNGSPEEVEFLGNGMPYPGMSYSRAVILIWPKEHRRDVQSHQNADNGPRGASFGGFMFDY